MSYPAWLRGRCNGRDLLQDWPPPGLEPIRGCSLSGRGPCKGSGPGARTRSGDRVELVPALAPRHGIGAGLQYERPKARAANAAARALDQALQFRR